MQYESCSQLKQIDYMKIPDSNYLVCICIRKIWIWPSFRRLLAFCWRLKHWRPDNFSLKSVKIWWLLCRMQCCAKASYGSGSVVDVVSWLHHSNLILNIFDRYNKMATVSFTAYMHLYFYTMCNRDSQAVTYYD